MKSNRSKRGSHMHTKKTIAVALVLLAVSGVAAATKNINWNGPMYYCRASSGDGTTLYVAGPGKQDWPWSAKGLPMIQAAWTRYLTDKYPAAQLRDIKCAEDMDPPIEDTVLNLKKDAVDKLHFARVVELPWEYSGPPPS